MHVFLHVVEDVMEDFIEGRQAEDLYFCIGVIEKLADRICHLYHFEVLVEKLQVVANELKQLFGAFES